LSSGAAIFGSPSAGDDRFQSPNPTQQKARAWARYRIIWFHNARSRQTRHKPPSSQLRGSHLEPSRVRPSPVPTNRRLMKSRCANALPARLRLPSAGSIRASVWHRGVDLLSCFPLLPPSRRLRISGQFTSADPRSHGRTRGLLSAMGVLPLNELISKGHFAGRRRGADFTRGEPMGVGLSLVREPHARRSGVPLYNCA